MSGLSNYTQNAILNWIKGTTMPAAPAALYVGLFDGDPTDAGSGGTEVTSTIRVAGRVAVTFGAISANTTIANSADVDFGNAAAAADATHFGVFDAPTGGNMIGSNPLTGGSQAITPGTGVKFATGALVVNID